MLTTITTAFIDGGIWMWAIAIAQVVSIAIIVERIWKLYVWRNSDQTTIVNHFEKDIRSGQFEKVLLNTRAHRRRSPIYSVLTAGTQAAVDMGGREEIQAQMDEVLLSENQKLEARTGLLAMLANVGTLLGLLGTIVGLIQAFAAVSGDPIEKANRLTQGISMAMNTTAYGLIMAIPALVMYGVLQSRSQKLANDLNQAALKAFNWLSFKYEMIPRRKVRQRE